MVNYKLIYFDLRGAAEVIRQIFEYCEVEYEDCRVTRKEWMDMKEYTPFGKLPILEVDGKPLAQSHAIARYLAREFGINGKCAFEEAQVNALADQFKDYISEIRRYIFVKAGKWEGDIEQLRKDVFVPSFHHHFQIFENILKVSQSGYFVGESLTWIDLLIAEHVRDVVEQEDGIIEEYVEVRRHQMKIHSIDRISEWIGRRNDCLY